MYQHHVLTEGPYMFPTFQGHEVKPSRTADREMVDLRIYMDDVLKILEHGKDAKRSRRKRGTIEKKYRIRGKMIKVVVASSITRWNNERVWLITHVGETRGE